MPDILRLTIAAWMTLPPIAVDAKEDEITLALCRALQRDRTARCLPFQIRPQQAEADPAPGEEMGRLDIAFNLLVPAEEIYFCLEGKRLNVMKNDCTRAYASEYVKFGMMRLVTGQYAPAVRHGGMIGYVLDKDVPRAIKNVAVSMRRQHVALCMVPPGTLLPSAVLESESRARESHHLRQIGTASFHIHHLFMAPS